MKNTKKLVAMVLTAVCLLGLFGYTGGVSTYNEKNPVVFF